MSTISSHCDPSAQVSLNWTSLTELSGYGERTTWLCSDMVVFVSSHESSLTQNKTVSHSYNMQTLLVTCLNIFPGTVLDYD